MILNRIIYTCYILLFGLVPFLFFSKNFELFEFNKMMAVYFLTILITAAWQIKIIHQKKWLWHATPLDLPLLIFLISQVLSTIFSIDRHTSIFGYYSRLNGGLLSTICYLLLYFAFTANFKNQASAIFRLLKVGLVSGVLISIWAILEHFGHSISCQILTGDFSDNCWVQDVQARVFATLGQPNWLAAYLEMLLFIGIYFFLMAKTRLSQVLYLVSCLLIYLAFTFTYSRGAMLGLVGGLAVFLGGGFWITKQDIRNKKYEIRSHLKSLNSYLLVLISFAIINLLFASALTSFKLIHQDAPPPRPGIVQSASQLESGGTESGQIRLIVWQGAWQIFQHYPFFGSGVETFAYSYYNFRPVAHNFVSEWDFLYNKAHNEYLNYLSTTGLIGFLSYILIILTFIIWSLKRIFQKTQKDSASQKIKSSDFASSAESSKLLTLAFLGAYVSYLIQNFFQFSVVIIAVFFFLFPATVFSLTDLKKVDFWPLPALVLPKSLTKFLSRLALKIIAPKFGRQIVMTVIFIVSAFLLITVRNLWVADTHYALGKHYLDNNNAGQSYNEMVDAVSLNTYEPLYLGDLGLAASNAALALSSEDATFSAQLVDQSVSATLESLNVSRRNVSLWRTAYRSFFVLAAINPKYQAQTLDAIDTVTLLAPTDPETYLNKALILNAFEKTDQAVYAPTNAIALKPDYRDAKLTLADLYIKLGQKDQAKAVLNDVLKQIPGDPDALGKLKGI